MGLYLHQPLVWNRHIIIGGATLPSLMGDILPDMISSCISLNLSIAPSLTLPTACHLNVLLHHSWKTSISCLQTDGILPMNNL